MIFLVDFLGCSYNLIVKIINCSLFLDFGLILSENGFLDPPYMNSLYAYT